MNKFFELTYWKKGMSATQAKDIAYTERNLLALAFADGWYYDIENDWPGWKRVLSLKNGSITFHVPDDFPVGSLPEIDCNWDGHTNEQKWARILNEKGIAWR